MLDINKNITPRLLMVASLVPKSDTVCDIGTDHGYVPIYLIKKGIAKKVIAADINKGPLSAAKENIKQYNEAQNIETRLSDGFCAFAPGEAQTAVISGMGGETIASILKKDIGASAFVLQPQTTMRELREFLCENNYIIEKEAVCREGRKMYVAMRAVRGKSRVLNEIELEIGPMLIKERPPLFCDYVLYRLYEINKVLGIIKGTDTAEEKIRKYTFLKTEYEKLLV